MVNPDKSIPQEYKKYGTTYKLVMSQTFVRSKRLRCRAIFEGDTHYEVIIMTWQPDIRRVQFPNQAPIVQLPHWEIPTTSQWGNLGWTCGTLINSFDKYNSINIDEDL